MYLPGLNVNWLELSPKEIFDLNCGLFQDEPKGTFRHIS
jgi:hypothetical protein